MFQLCQRNQRCDAVSDGRSLPAWNVSGLLEAMRLDVMSGLGRCLLIMIMLDEDKTEFGGD